MISSAFLKSVRLERDKISDLKKFPFTVPSINRFIEMEINSRVTFFVGENGSGKSTLLEAIAIAAGFNAEGGSQNLKFTTRESHSELHNYLRLVRGTSRPKDGFFLRAESLFTVATEIDRIGASMSYGGKSLHEQSHGESFLSVMSERLRGNGLYIFDEPEAALSPSRQMSLLSVIHKLIEKNSQFIIATHSPILMAYPGATIYLFSEKGIAPVSYEDTEHVKVTRDFLLHREKILGMLLAE